jgi:hypothetical protein
VHHPYHLDAIRPLAVEDDISFHRKEANILPNVGTRWSEAWVYRQDSELLVDKVEYAIGRRWIPRGDVRPELDQVRLGAWRADDAAHLSDRQLS